LQQLESQDHQAILGLMVKLDKKDSKVHQEKMVQMDYLARNIANRHLASENRTSRDELVAGHTLIK